MCLAVPLQIEILVDDANAQVRQGSSLLDVDISLLESAKIGDYVIVHAGFAIETLDLEEAEERLDLFRQLEEA